MGRRPGDRRGSAVAAEDQRDLPEVLARAKTAQLATVLPDLDLAGLHDEELVARRALLGEHLASWASRSSADDAMARSPCGEPVEQRDVG